jgi:hypothetical protein
MINDRLTSGAIAGTIAAIAKTGPNYIFNILGVTRHTYPTLIVMILLKNPKAHSFWPFLLGIIIDSIIGGTLGIIIIYILKISGRRYSWFKGIIFGSLTWLIGPTILLPLFYPELSLNFHYVSLFDHWLFGLATVFFVKKLYPDTEQLL